MLPSKSKKIVVVYSGGMDSTVLLYDLLRRQKMEPFALSINYGQRHLEEILAAEQICEGLGVPHDIVDLSDLAYLLPGGSQTDKNVPVPHGHYTAENMKATVVPNRNMILLAVAASVAITREAEWIGYAAHAGDHAIYPDCRTVFANAMSQALALCHFTPVKLYHPYIYNSKADIAKLGFELGVPFEKTWSCYEGGKYPCGKCGTCQERIMAFYLTNQEDPLDYGRPWKEVLADALKVEETKGK